MELYESFFGHDDFEILPYFVYGKGSTTLFTQHLLTEYNRKYGTAIFPKQVLLKVKEIKGSENVIHFFLRETSRRFHVTIMTKRDSKFLFNGTIIVESDYTSVKVINNIRYDVDVMTPEGKIEKIIYKFGK